MLALIELVDDAIFVAAELLSETNCSSADCTQEKEEKENTVEEAPVEDAAPVEEEAAQETTEDKTPSLQEEGTVVKAAAETESETTAEALAEQVSELDLSRVEPAAEIEAEE